jgi:hypothetical protein
MSAPVPDLRRSEPECGGCAESGHHRGGNRTAGFDPCSHSLSHEQHVIPVCIRARLKADTEPTLRCQSLPVPLWRSGKKMPAARCLATILAADAADYSRLMGADEEGTLEHVNAYRRELIDPKIRERRGRIFKTSGNGVLAEFASVIDMARRATHIQRAMLDRDLEITEERRLRLVVTAPETPANAWGVREPGKLTEIELSPNVTSRDTEIML